MNTNNFYKLNKSKSVLIADRYALLAFFQTSNERLFQELYKDIYVTPELYKYFIKTLDIDSLKIFKSCVKQVMFNANASALHTIMRDAQILTEDEAYAVLYSTKSGVDVVMDDPRKVEKCQEYGVYVIRPSDIVAAAATSLYGSKGR